MFSSFLAVLVIAAVPYGPEDVRDFFLSLWSDSMAAPTPGTITVTGIAGGMAPHGLHWSANCEVVPWATGSGEWCEGRWHFQCIDVATGTIYADDTQDVTCPISGTVTASAFNRYGAAPNAACLIRDAGTYTVRLRYENRDGDVSAWVTSANITVSADTRTPYYVDGDKADDSGDGLTMLTAKKSLNAAMALIRANDRTIVMKDNTTINSGDIVDKSAFSGIWITRSGAIGDITPPTLVLNQTGVTPLFIQGDTWVVEGFTQEHDGVADRSLFNIAVNSTNMCVTDITTNELKSFAEITSNRNFDGLYIHNITMAEDYSAYFLFASAFERLAILGCTLEKASTVTHFIRTCSNAAEVAKYLSIDFTSVDMQGDGAAGKCCWRNYITKFAGAYRSSFRNAGMQWGNIDVLPGAPETFEQFRWDCCRWQMEAEQTIIAKIGLVESTKNLFLSACRLISASTGNAAVFESRSRGGGGADSVDNIILAGCSIGRFDRAMTSSSLIHGGAIDVDTLFEMRGVIWDLEDMVIDAAYKEIVNHHNSDVGVLSVTDCAWYLHGSLDHDLIHLEDPGGDTVYKSVAAINATGWGSGNIDLDVTLNHDTGEGVNYITLGTLLSDVTGMFESINGEVIDRGDVSWPAGCWWPIGSGTGEDAGHPEAPESSSSSSSSSSSEPETSPDEPAVLPRMHVRNYGYRANPHSWRRHA